MRLLYPMMQLMLFAVAFWLSLFDMILAWVGWRGLTWGSLPVWRALVPIIFRRLWRVGPRALIALGLTLLPALLGQVGLASVRNYHLNPLLHLRPGRYADRDIIRLDIPTVYGAVPALHIIPHNGVRVAVCVAHGSGCDKTFYAWSLVDQLLRLGIAVLLIDLDGHGESPRVLAFPRVLQNIVGAVAWLYERYERVGLLGMSLGGCVAARAVADGVTVDALVVLEAPPRVHLTRQQINTIIVPREALRLLRPAVLSLLREGSVYHIMRAWKTTGIRSTLSAWELFDALDFSGSLRRITAQQRRDLPLLLIYGSKDAIVSLSDIALVEKDCPPWAVFLLLPGASHLSLPIESRTLRLVAVWLEKQLLLSTP